jgi:chromate transporter
MIYILLFITFAKIGLFSFGGGYAMLPFIQQEVVSSHHWLLNKDFIDIVAISQMTPGPIAINAATFVGFKVAGFWGSFAATTGLVLFPFLLMLIITRLYVSFKKNQYLAAALAGIRPALLGLIAAAAVLLGKDSIIDLKSAGIFVFILAISMRFRTNPVYLILISGLLGFVLF